MRQEAMRELESIPIMSKIVQDLAFIKGKNPDRNQALQMGFNKNLLANGIANIPKDILNHPLN